MSDQLAAIILGLVQGLTEFLPVSSTAHLILVSDALKLDPDKFGLSFDVAALFRLRHRIRLLTRGRGHIGGDISGAVFGRSWLSTPYLGLSWLRASHLVHDNSFRFGLANDRAGVMR